MTVQRVHVGDGGRAIVGDVNAPPEGVGARKKVGDRPHALAYAPGVEMPRHVEAERQKVHTLSAYATNARLTLAQRSVPEKTNEIIAIPDLLDHLAEAKQLKGALDACMIWLAPICGI